MTGVCSRGNFDLVTGLGCVKAIDYTGSDAVGELEQYPQAG